MVFFFNETARCSWRNVQWWRESQPKPVWQVGLPPHQSNVAYLWVVIFGAYWQFVFKGCGTPVPTCTTWCPSRVQCAVASVRPEMWRQRKPERSGLGIRVQFKCSNKHGSANDKGPRIASNRHSVAGLVASVPHMLQQDKNIWRECGHMGAVGMSLN